MSITGKSYRMKDHIKKKPHTEQE
nr:hypothetical protein [Dubosiella newyorkensis]